MHSSFGLCVVVGTVLLTGARGAGQVATPANQSPTSTNQSPAATPPADPASSAFTTDAGLLLVIIKPTAVADYELAIRTLQEALAKEKNPERAQAARGWRVFKAAEPDAKGNQVFVHVLLPAVKGFDYRPSLLLDELVQELPADLLTKYQDAFAAPPTRLSLTEFAAMSVAPVESKPGEEEKKKPEPSER
jgi:hypothetical protein